MQRKFERKEIFSASEGTKRERTHRFAEGITYYNPEKSEKLLTDGIISKN